MSLFESASLCITPNGTKASKLYSIKPTDGSGDLSVTRATSATRVNASGLIELVGANVPRLDYSNGTCPSILVEPQRTNLLLNSLLSGGGAAPTNWTSTIGTGSSFQIVSEKSSIGVAYRQVAVAQRPFIEQSRILAASTVYTASMIIEEVSGLKYNQILAINGITPSSYKINGLTVLSTATATKGKLEATFTTLGSGSIGIRYGIGGNGAATGTLTFSCPQLEAASYATSYIPTTSASVTRNADVISKTGISSLIGQTEGTMFVEIDWVNINKNVIFSTISDGSVNSFIIMGFTNLDRFFLYSEVNGITQYNLVFINPMNGKYKIAVGYKENDIVFYINGSLVNFDNTANVAQTSQLNLGGFITSGSEYPNRITALWKTRLSNSELAEITSL